MVLTHTPVGSVANVGTRIITRNGFAMAVDMTGATTAPIWLVRRIQMSLEENRTKLLKLSETRKSDFLLIRSPADVDKIDPMNSDMSDLLDFGDPEVIRIVERGLSAGRQVAVQGAGTDRVLVHTAKPGKKLFRYR